MVLVAANCSLVILGNNFFVYVQWHYITITTCAYFIWYHHIILACWCFLSSLLVWSSFYWNELNLCSPIQCCFLSTILGCFLLHLIHDCLSCFYTLLWNSQFCCILCMSSHMPATVSRDGCYHSICTSGFAGVFVCVCLLGLSLCVFFTIFSLSNSFTSVRLFMMVDWALCTSTLFAQDNTSLLVIFHFHVSLWVPGLFLLTEQCHLNHE